MSIKLVKEMLYKINPCWTPNNVLWKSLKADPNSITFLAEIKLSDFVVTAVLF